MAGGMAGRPPKSGAFRPWSLCQSALTWGVGMVAAGLGPLETEWLDRDGGRSPPRALQSGHLPPLWR